jgi:hypothetical protein
VARLRVRTGTAMPASSVEVKTARSDVPRNDLSSQSGEKRTLIRSQSPIAIYEYTPHCIDTRRQLWSDNLGIATQSPVLAQSFGW